MSETFATSLFEWQDKDVIAVCHPDDKTNVAERTGLETRTSEHLAPGSMFIIDRDIADEFLFDLEIGQQSFDVEYEDEEAEDGETDPPS